jgi:hypothetical protein
MKAGNRMAAFSDWMVLSWALVNVPAARFLLGLCIVLCDAYPARSDKAPARESFLQQYEPHAEALEGAYTNVYVKWRQSNEIEQGKLAVAYIDGKYNRVSYCWNIGRSATVDTKTKQVISSRKDDSIDCRNAHYLFRLWRQDENHEYFLKKLNIYSGHEPVLDVQNSLSPFNVPYADYIKKKTYLEVAQDPETHIVTFEDCLWQNKTRKALTTRFFINDPGSKRQVDCINVYYFSPEDGWICCGMKSYVADGSAREGLEERYFYEAKEGGQFPPLKRIEQWVYNLQDTSKSRLRATTEIDQFRRSPVPFPDSDFRLTVFGLPEPMGAEPLPYSRSWLWLLAATVTAVALAMLFAWLKRRHARKAPRSSTTS